MDWRSHRVIPFAGDFCLLASYDSSNGQAGVFKAMITGV